MTVSLRRWSWPRFLLVASGALVALAVLALGLYASSPAGSTLPPAPAASPKVVVVEGVDLMLNYTGHSNDNFSYFEAPECAHCPVTASPGQSWSFSFGLTNHDSMAHRFLGVHLTPPVTLLATAATATGSLAPGATTTVTLTIELPGAPGAYFLTGSISVA